MQPPILFAPDTLREFSERFEQAPPTEVLHWAWQEFGLRAAIGTSFQGAGLVIIHHAVTAGLPLPVFTIDTGLLFSETNDLKSRLEDFFGIQIEALVPELSLSQQEAELGKRLWERQPDLCCTVRKVVPLQKKLAELEAWVTGLRRDQSSARSGTQVLELYEFDRIREKQILKINPLAALSRDDVWHYIRKHCIPYNPLHDRGFRSIGCRPCTRAVVSGQDDRAGRWIGFEKTECGIHTFMGENI